MKVSDLVKELNLTVFAERQDWTRRFPAATPATC